MPPLPPLPTLLDWIWLQRERSARVPEVVDGEEGGEGQKRSEEDAAKRAGGSPRRDGHRWSDTIMATVNPATTSSSSLGRMRMPTATPRISQRVAARPAGQDLGRPVGHQTRATRS